MVYETTYELKEEIIRLKEKFSETFSDVNTKYRTEITDLKLDQKIKLHELVTKHKEDIEALNVNHFKEIINLQKQIIEKDNIINRLKEASGAIIEEGECKEEVGDVVVKSEKGSDDEGRRCKSKKRKFTNER